MRIGIDLGGTKIEGIVMGDEGQILHRMRRPTPASEGYGAVVEAVSGLVMELEAECGASCRVGMGTPGAISQVTGMMKNSNTLCLNGQNFLGDVEASLSRTVRMANDANCFALSEAIDGAGRGFDVVFGVILGTGVGGGLVINRRAREGLHGIAGEWGHNPLDETGPLWFDGQRGPVEAFLCGGGLARLYVEAGGTEGASGQRVVEGLRRGEEAAVMGFDRYMDYFGRAVSVIINILDPDCIVLGGGVSNVDEIYTRAHAALKPYVFNDEVKTPILQNVHGDSSGVRGAALLWEHDA